jgi:splicing factor, arginine/serine-rich 17
MRSEIILFLKEGSRLKVDYDVTWDCEGFFRISQYEPARNNLEERNQVP